MSDVPSYPVSKRRRLYTVSSREDSLLASLSQEVLEMIVLLLDLNSINALLKTSTAIESRLANSSEGFWKKLADRKGVKIPFYSKLRRSGQTSFELVRNFAQLHENVTRVGPNSVWRCKYEGFEPIMLEKRNISFALPPEMGNLNWKCAGRGVLWNGDFALLDLYKKNHLSVWDLRREKPQLIQNSVQVPKDFKYNCHAFKIWQEWLLFSTVQEPDDDSDVVLMRMVSLADFSAVRFCVKVPAAQNITPKVCNGFLDVLEDGFGNAWAVVNHVRNPCTIYVISLLTGETVKEIALPDGMVSFCFYQKRHTALPRSVLNIFVAEGERYIGRPTAVVTLKTTGCGTVLISDLVPLTTHDVVGVQDRFNDAADVTRDGNIISALIFAESKTFFMAMARPRFGNGHHQLEFDDNLIWERLCKLEEGFLNDRLEILVRCSQEVDVAIVTIHNWASREAAYVYALSTDPQKPGQVLYKLNLGKATAVGMALSGNRFVVAIERNRDDRVLEHFEVTTGQKLSSVKLRKNNVLKETDDRFWHSLRGRQMLMTDTDILLPLDSKVIPEVFDLIRYW